MRQQAHAWKGVGRHELQDLLDAEEYVRVRRRFQGAPQLEQGHRLSNMLTQQQQNKTETETNAQKQQTHEQKHQTQKNNTHETENTQTLKLHTKKNKN
jgi:Mg-chelatase subunit ChlI